jgi:hypothetical protein
LVANQKMEIWNSWRAVSSAVGRLPVSGSAPGASMFDPRIAGIPGTHLRVPGYRLPV